ncbi:MAG: type II secretion system F family protein [Planctomycetaceae bacterium]|nr:type II secretion system F family protein [Planctomycetaceae bacterium]
MDTPDELRALRALWSLVRDGIPLFEALRIVARQPGFGFLAGAEAQLSDGATLTDSLPGLPPAFRPILRWGERTGLIVEALEHVGRWWPFPVDTRLPLYYLARAVGSAELPRLAEEGREVFAVDHDWKKFGAELGGGATVVAASSGKPRILPRPYDAVLAGAEASGNLAELLLALWEGSQRGLVPYEPARDRGPALKQAFYAGSLLMTAGHPLKETLAALAASFPQVKDLSALRADDFVASLEGAFTPSVRALLRKACDCGDLSLTLRRIVEDLERGWLPL